MASRTRRFFLNAVSLTATALIMRAVSVIFNIYVSNRAGSETMGLYSLLGSVYSFAITVGSAGINLGVTRLVSDALGVGDVNLARKSAMRSIACCTVTGCIAGALLFIFSNAIGELLLGDVRAIVPMRILALTLVPVAVCSCLSGYFTAVRRVKVNAFFQVSVQLFKIGITVLLLFKFVDLGPEQACIALVLGGAIAEFVSLIITLVLYLFDLKKLKKVNIASKQTVPILRNNGKIIKKLLSITLPVTFSACVRSALTMFQHVLVPKGLAESGLSWANALSSYGALHGMALPLILFPSALISAFAGLLIPEVSECRVRSDSPRLCRVSYRALTFSLFFSVGICGIMIFFSRELGLIVYKSEDVATYIRILSPLIPVMYIDSAVDAVLKGSGHQVYSMNINIIDALTSCILALTLIPRIGIWGYIISIYATEILNTSLSLSKMISISKIKLKIVHQLIMPILCVIGATHLSNIILSTISPQFNSSAQLALNILLTVILYIILLLITKTLGTDEFEFLNASILSEKQYNKKFRSVRAIENGSSPRLIPTSKIHNKRN